jgi:diguanylate cyclase (GGDEF)-like protein
MDGVTPESLQAELAACEAARETGQHAQGAESGARALAQARALGDALLAARAAALLAHHRWRQGYNEQALPLAEAALDDTDALGPPEWSIDLRHTLTMSLCELGLPGEALVHATAALERARDLGLPLWLSWSLNRLSAVYDSLGNADKSVELITQAAQAAERSGDREARFSCQVNLAASLRSVADSHQDAGRADDCRTAAELALDAARCSAELAGDHPLWQMYSAGIEVHALRLLGRHEETAARIDEHQAIAQLLGLEHFVVLGETMRARWLLASGHAEAAWQWIEQKLRLDGLEHDDILLRRAFEVRHLVAKATGRLAAALHAAEQLLDLERRASAQRVQAQSRVLLRMLEVQAARDETERLRVQAAELAQQAAEATHAALADALTGMANRRALDARLRDWLLPEAILQAPFAAALIDIDHFKRINDNHGHDAGDAVLRALARLLEAGTREGDFVARNGGEEFVLLMRGASLDTAAEVCERLRRTVEQHDWQTVLPAGGVTISLGLSAAQPGDEGSSLLRRADMAMYAAKHAGRNRLVIDSPCC